MVVSSASCCGVKLAAIEPESDFQSAFFERSTVGTAASHASRT